MLNIFLMLLSTGSSRLFILVEIWPIVLMLQRWAETLHRLGAKSWSLRRGHLRRRRPEAAAECSGDVALGPPRTGGQDLVVRRERH